MRDRFNLLLIFMLLFSRVVAEKQGYIVPKPQIIEIEDNEFDPSNDDVSITIMAEDKVYLEIFVSFA